MSASVAFGITLLFQFWDLSERTDFALVRGIHVIATRR
jgi:hypothetical protein